MSARVSTRISIRWPPEPASEPTDTLVLSLGGYYVDLRIDKASGNIDWALAGQRIVISEDPRTVPTPRRFLYQLTMAVKVEFTHPLDSHCRRPGDEEHNEQADVGEFSKLPNGDDLEVGEMAAPHMGARVMPYEEVWRESDAGVASDGLVGQSRGWILEGVHEEKRKTFYARVGRHFLAVQRQDKPGRDTEYEYAAVREECSDGKWTKKYMVGNTDHVMSMASLTQREDAQRRSVGDVVNIGNNSQGIVRSIAED